MKIKLADSVFLRPWEFSDQEDIVESLNNPQVLKYLGERIPFPYTSEDAAEWVSCCRSKSTLYDFAIEVEGKAGGAISLVPQEDVYRRSMEIGYWLAESFHGRGLMSLATGAIIKYAFDNFEINRVFARPFGDNLQSVRVLEKNGFKLEGRLKEAVYKNKQYHDSLVYALVKKSET